ncbi:MAG: DUF3696 domain-containing protein [Anaerolineae bacterium]|nr:DUF3696 domain-containing protein [Anaerolineae bacterium]
MLTQLRMQNFKSWRDTDDLVVAPLTGIFGENSSGKTSLLQMMLMLKQTVESPDRRRVLHFGDDRALVDLGTFRDVIAGHNTELPLTFSLTWELPKPLMVTDPETRRRLFSTNSLSFTTTVAQDDEKLIVEEFEYRFDDYHFGMTRRPSAGNRRKQEYDLISDPFRVKRTVGRQWPLPVPVKCYGFPDEATGYYQNTGFLPDFELAFEDLFAQIAYLGPLREYPRRSYVWAGDYPEDVGQRGELAVHALLASRVLGKVISPGYRRRKRTVEERIGEWLKELGLIYSFSLSPIAEHRRDYELRVRTKSGGSEVLITDVGFGVSQILPVLVLCYYVPEGSIIILEQPEIHLHPSVQAGLADVLIDVVNNRNVQIIVESHSEHLLTRLQRRIAEEKIAPEKTALYFCTMPDAESRIERLDVDLFGNINNWPPNFFGDEMGDRIAMTEAALRRQMGAGA